jgi:hypothetical protein
MPGSSKWSLFLRFTHHLSVLWSKVCWVKTLQYTHSNAVT